MDRFEAMSMFAAVTEKGSFSAASRALHVPLATLSRKISDLETLLGVQLLTRTTRKLALTEAGIAYLAAARRILEQVEEAEREAAGEFIAPRGELVITAPISFGRRHLLPIVSQFLATFPEINVRLLQSDRNLHLVDDHVDMAVRIGALPDSSMVATRVGSMRTVTCLSPRLAAGHGRPTEPNDLQRMPCVAFDMGVPSPHWSYRSPGPGLRLEVAIQPRLSVTTADAAAEAAIDNVGVTRLLHYQVADAVDRGQLDIVLEAFEREPAPVHLVHVPRGQMPLKMRRFLSFAAPRLRQALTRFSGKPAADAPSDDEPGTSPQE
ncbi:LysR family transcriptional regulator [Ancylobacter mangrovi]|uniref:LysR family transcriptional regulator n=1 Tax=Ancylobacter mangrovi TaxID=2972472 RepID=UPI002163D2DC|nr:LysR family transcriptional regulator [Ancylobacter mangrovi]MCS0503632.1 LysR family transcriptional regulator [Ancylobacter mangrovi]